MLYNEVSFRNCNVKCSCGSIVGLPMSIIYDPLEYSMRDLPQTVSGVRNVDASEQ